MPQRLPAFAGPIIDVVILPVPVPGEGVIIVNADDWGRSKAETDAALSCHREGRITSVTAMVFMADSERSAQLAKEGGVDVGLHLNLTEPFSSAGPSGALRERHGRIARFLTRSKYACLVYNPMLRSDFQYVYQAQMDEFNRLYGKPPSHVDGHQHQHLCANILLGEVIPRGEKVRRAFYFWPGEKGSLNRAYRYLVNRLIASRYPGPEYFFALPQCFDRARMARVIALARTATVEMMTHPVNCAEREYLMGDDYLRSLDAVGRGVYRML